MEPQHACALSSRSLSAFVCLPDMRNISSTGRSSNTQKQPSHLPLTFFFFFYAKLNNSFFFLPLISQGFQASPLAFTESVTFVFLLNCKARRGAHPPYSGLLFATPSPAAPSLNRLTILPADQPSFFLSHRTHCLFSFHQVLPNLTRPLLTPASTQDLLTLTWVTEMVSSGLTTFTLSPWQSIFRSVHPF